MLCKTARSADATRSLGNFHFARRTSDVQNVAFLAGYLAIWTAFALLAFAGDTLLHQVVKE